MKINLSKEHLKKGCDIIWDKRYKFYESTIYLTYEDHSLWFEDDNFGNGRGLYIADLESPLYRDFLQLVIEAIEKKEIVHFEYNYCTNTIQVFNDRIPCSESFLATLDCNTITEANERAIAYVFYNMEAKK